MHPYIRVWGLLVQEDTPLVHSYIRDRSAILKRSLTVIQPARPRSENAADGELEFLHLIAQLLARRDGINDLERTDRGYPKQRDAR